MQITDLMYQVIDLKKEHNISTDQAFYLLAVHNGMDWVLPSAEDLVSLFNKKLLKKTDEINESVVFRNREEVKEEMKAEGTANREAIHKTELSIQKTDSIEAKFVPEDWLTEEERVRIAEVFFKGDTTIARYFIIFKCLFPSKDIKRNHKWNQHFGIIHNGISLWDAHIRVAKKFLEIYHKVDMGVFLTGTYFFIKDSIDMNQEKCFATKPFKYLSSCKEWINYAQEQFDKFEKQQTKAAEKPFKEEGKPEEATSSDSYL